MRDFTLSVYKQLLIKLKERNYTFLTFEELISKKNIKGRVIVLRHDIDLLPPNALKSAQIEYNLKIKGSYYFRIGTESNNPAIIKKIADLGHEIGYHYETMDSCRGNVDKAFKEFCKNLEYFRKFYPVKTVCMHGSPRSDFDNRKIWEKYNYHDSGIIGEPYFDVDFKKVLYITDTGRRWNGDKFSVRDKVDTGYNFNFRTTLDIIDQINLLPEQIMITVHPQRWNDEMFKWLRELVMQNVKNMVKRMFFVKKLEK